MFSLGIYPHQRGPFKVEILRRGDSSYTGHHTKTVSARHSLFIHFLETFTNFSTFAYIVIRRQKFFSLEGDSVITFHATSETVDELPNLAAVDERYSCKHFVWKSMTSYEWKDFLHFYQFCLSLNKTHISKVHNHRDHFEENFDDRNNIARYKRRLHGLQNHEIEWMFRIINRKRFERRGSLPRVEKNRISWVFYWNRTQPNGGAKK